MAESSIDDAGLKEIPELPDDDLDSRYNFYLNLLKADFAKPERAVYGDKEKILNTFQDTDQSDIHVDREFVHKVRIAILELTSSAAVSFNLPNGNGNNVKVYIKSIPIILSDKAMQSLGEELMNIMGAYNEKGNFDMNLISDPGNREIIKCLIEIKNSNLDIQIFGHLQSVTNGHAHLGGRTTNGTKNH